MKGRCCWATLHWLVNALSSNHEEATVTFYLGRIRIRFGVNHFPSFPLDVKLFRRIFVASSKPPSRDNHRKASYSRQNRVTKMRVEPTIMRSWLSEKRRLYPLGRASERKISRGYEGRYRAPKCYWAPQALSGPTPLNHFLSDGCRSSFKSEGIAIFAYTWDLWKTQLDIKLV